LPGLLRLCTVLAVVFSTAATARAAETSAMGKAPVDRMIDLNWRAYADIKNQRFSAAKYWLDTALVISETAGLESDAMTARTYVHFAVVHLTGLKDRDEAIRQLERALKIDPNITITSGLETPALKAAYLEARERLGLPPNPDPTATIQPPAAKPTATETEVPRPPVKDRIDLSWTSSQDPDLPARVPAPLYCAVPFEVPRGKDLLIRCVTQKQQKRASATLYYRPSETSPSFLALPMSPSPKGWLVATVPGTDLEGKVLAYYVRAHLPGSQLAIYSGYPETPISVLIKNDGTAATADRATAPPIPSDGHRRPPGAVWLGLGIGTGTVYHGREPVDSNSRTTSDQPVHVEAGFSPAGRFQVEPEVGFQLTPRFSLSLMLRWQYAPKDPAGDRPGPNERAVLTSAMASFARGQLCFGGSGNLQPFTSLGVGFGNPFLAVVGKRCSPGQCALDHSDTLHGGSVGLLASLGVLYHLSPRLALVADLKEIVAVPKVMALTEFNFGLQGAHAFGAGAPPARVQRSSPLSSP
jgi:hypothetical protein